MKELNFSKEVYIKALEEYHTLQQVIGELQDCSLATLCEKFHGFSYDGEETGRYYDLDYDYFDLNYGLLTVTMYEDLVTGEKYLGDVIDVWGDKEVADYDQLSYEELKSVVNNYKG